MKGSGTEMQGDWDENARGGSEGDEPSDPTSDWNGNEAEDLEYEWEDEDGSTRGRKTRRYGNNRPNYGGGKRFKLFQLIMYAGLLPTKAISLIDDPDYAARLEKKNEAAVACGDTSAEEKKKKKPTDDKDYYMKRKARIMAEEGTLKKCVIADEMAYRIRKMPVGEEMKSLAAACPKTVEFYQQGRKTQTNRVNSTENDAVKMYRNAEAILFCDRLPVKYLPEDKGAVGDPTNESEYFTSQEIKLDSKMSQEDEGRIYEIGGTRNNGVLFTPVGAYVFYNFSNWEMSFSHTKSGETALAGYVNEKSRSKGLPQKQSVVMLYRKDKVLKNVIEQRGQYGKSISILYDAYNLQTNEYYALPLSEAGQIYASIMLRPRWRETVYGIFDVRKPELRGGWNSMYYSKADGVEVDEDGMACYVYCFAVPEISNFTSFCKYAQESADKSKFLVKCLDFQEEFLRNLLPGVRIESRSLDELMELLRLMEEQ